MLIELIDGQARATHWKVVADLVRYDLRASLRRQSACNSVRVIARV